MVIRAIVILNAIVFLLWFLASTESHYIFMMENFTISWSGLLAGRFWTLLTSAFSHNAFWHFLLNMYVLYGFGYALKHVVGRKSFLLFYLIAGISGSLTHALVSEFFLHSPDLPALGASGAIAGIIMFFSLTFPREKLLLMGFILVRARYAAIMIVALDLWGLSAQSQGGGLPIGHGAHLGGALIGLVYYFFRRSAHGLTPHQG